MKALDLFAGCGGLSLGLQMAGIAAIGAVERDPDACASYRANVGDHVIEASIEDVEAADLPDCDLIAGGPPCQGFSYAGKRDKDDPRNRLWREFFRIVEAKQPAWLLIENVRGQLTMGVDKQIVLAFRAIGYHVSPYLLNAADYGVPQRRLRVFYVGNRIGVANPCPPQTHAKPPGHLMLGLQPWVTVRQALGIGGNVVGIRDMDDACLTIRSDHHGAWNPPKGHPHYFEPMLDILDSPSRALRAGTHGHPGYSDRHVAGYIPTDRADHGVLDLDEPSCAIKAGGAFDASGHEGGATPPALPYVKPDEPSPTIQGGGADTGGAEPVRHRIKGDEHIAELHDYAPTIQADSPVSRPGHHGPNDPRMALRRLTVRECMTLQSFPEWFALSGCKTSQYRQNGNAVPPLLAKALGEAMLHKG